MSDQNFTFIMTTKPLSQEKPETISIQISASSRKEALDKIINLCTESIFEYSNLEDAKSITFTLDNPTDPKLSK
jgi:hypothetical protein